MKKNILSLILVLAVMLMMTVSASADSQTGKDGWTVEFTVGNKMVSNFKGSEIADAASNLQPGDDITFTITLKNTSGNAVNWYMLNRIINSLEDTQSKASGGAYSYLLTYTTSAGGTITLYDSDTVGGELSTGSTVPVGLNEVESNLKNYMWLETMYSGRSGVVNLKVALDGESQGNSYQDSLADLQMRFAAEVVPTRTVVKTGDETMKLLPFYIGMAVAGILFIGLALEGIHQRKKKGGEEK